MTTTATAATGNIGAAGDVVAEASLDSRVEPLHNSRDRPFCCTLRGERNSLMPETTPETYRWKCPQCGKAYRRPKTRPHPDKCPACRAVEAEATRKNVLAELAETVADDPVGKPLAKPNSVFVPVPQRRPGIQAKIWAFAIVAILIGIISDALWRSRDRNTQSEAYNAACAIVAECMKSPKTAEFPRSGSFKKNFLGGWTVESFVDAKNPMGVPIRSSWSAWMKFDEKSKKWKCGYVDLENERVFESTFVAEMKSEMRRLTEADAEKRRENGKWEAVELFEGSGSERTAVFKPSLPDWRLKWKIRGEVAIHIYSNSGKLLKTAVERGRGDGEFLPELPAGEFRLRIRAADFRYEWIIRVEE